MRGLYTLALVLGLARGLVDATADGVLLARDGAVGMAAVYVAFALLSPVLGAAFEAVRGRTRVTTAVALTYVGLAVGGLIVRAAFLVTPGLAAPAYAVGSFVLMSLGNLALWGLVGRALTVEEGARHVGPIGAAELLGQLLGGLAAPIWARALAPEDALWPVVAALAASAVVALRTRTGRLELSTVAPGGAIAGDTRVIYVATASSLLTFYLVDQLFYRAAATQLGGEAELIALLGGVGALTALLGLGLRVVGTPRLSIQAGLVLAPLPALGLALLVPGGLGLWPLVVLRVLDRLAGQVGGQPAVQRLLQALPLPQQLRTRVRCDTLVEPLGTGLVGCFLLAGPPDSVAAGVLGVAAVVGLGVAARVARPGLRVGEV